MPITENGEIKYSIPSRIKSLITHELSIQFLKELHIIFGVSVEDADLDYFVYQGGTAGWNVALAAACRKLGVDGLYKYYLQLPWCDSDAFDCDFTDILVDQKLILGGFLYEEIARQNEIDKDLVQCCDRCGKYYCVSDIAKNEIDLGIEGDDEPWMEMVCKSCNNGEIVNPLPFNINRTIYEILNRDPSDFFHCEKCGKTHYITHRGEKFCLHCEQLGVSENENANNYYRDMLKEQERYRDKLLGKNEE